MKGLERLFLAVPILLTGCAAVYLVAKARAAAKEDTHSFPSYYTASKLLVSGAPLEKLEDRGWFRDQSRALGFKEPDVFWGNPPPCALVMAPLAAFFDPMRAREVWTWASLVFLLMGVEWIRRSGLRKWKGPTAGALLFFSFAAIFEPVHRNLELGQLYLFLFLIQTAACLWWREGKSFVAGAAAGAMVAFKGYGILFVGLALLRRDLRFVMGASVSFLALAVFSLALTGPRPWTDFFRIHLADPTFSAGGTPAMQTLKSAFTSLAALASASPAAPTWLFATAFSLIAIVLQLLLLGWLSTFVTEEKNAPSDFALVALIASSLIFSPRGADHVYCLTLTAFGLLLPRVLPVNSASLAVIGAAALVAFPFPFRERALKSPADIFYAYPRLWGAVLLLASALYREWASERASRSRATDSTSRPVSSQ